MAVLVDSSVWIEASRPENKESLKLKQLIRDRYSIHLLDLIQAEVCQGAKTETQFAQLWSYLDAFPKIKLDTNIYRHCAVNFFRLRKLGITLTTIDCLIATAAIENKMKLWSTDKVFIKIADAIGLHLMS